MKEITLQAKNEINWIIAIGLGFFLGLLSFFSPGALFNFLLILVIIFSIHLLSNKNERLFLSRIFIWGIIIRILLLFLIQFIFILRGKWFFLDVNRVISFFGDDGMHTIVAWWYAQYASGVPLSADLLITVLSSSLGDYGRSIYLYLLALFYYIFGYSPISVTLINCIISVLTGIVYYFIAKDITNLRSARITAILVTFFPSLIIWSISNLKDPLFIFLTGVILWLFLKFLENKKSIYLIFLIPLSILQSTIRKWVFWPTLLILGICYPVMRKRIKTLHIFLLIIIFFSISVVFKDRLTIIKSKLIDYHLGVVSTGGNTYRIYDNEMYNFKISTLEVPVSNFLHGFLRGWLHFFLEPFPWKVSSELSLVSFPQMLIWYFLIPFTVVGVLIQFRYNWNKSLVLIIYFVIIGSIFALTGGNIGTDFRMRDLLTPIMLLFSSIGIIKILYFKQDNLFINKDSG